MNAIVFDAVTKRYGTVLALENISFTLPSGGVHALAGANGSGKTTVLRLIAGLTHPTTGTIDCPSDRIGYAFQHPNIYPDLSVRENIDVFARLGDSTAAWTNHILEELRLHRVADRPARSLSDGYQKKLDLALAFSAEPPILLLDEPLADVDDLSTSNFLTLLDDYTAPDRIVVVATHNIPQFETCIDRLTVLHDGTVLDTSFDPDDIVSTYDTALTDLATNHE